jgi:hypothetical protein
MHFFHKSSEPDLAHSGSVPTHAGGDPSFSDPEKSSNQRGATEIISPLHRPWARKGATVDLSGSCTSIPMLPSIPVVEILAHNGLIHQMSRQTCLPASPNVSQLQADLASAPLLSTIRGSITKAFHAAKDGSNGTDTSQQPDDGASLAKRVGFRYADHGHKVTMLPRRIIFPVNCPRPSVQ